MSALGSLVVKLALDHAQYTQGLDRTSQEALKFAKNTQQNFDQAANSTKEFLGSVAGNVAGAIAGIVGLNASISQIRESINMLDRLDEASEKTGSSIEDLSRIWQVARNFGDAFEPIEQGITRLARGLAQVDNPSNDAIRALNAIGVNATDSSGKLRTAGDVYIEVAQKLQQYEDGAEKTAVANALFGKSGADLLPMLNNLASGVDQVRAMEEQAAKQAAQFNDAVALSKAKVNGLFTELAISLLPTLNDIASAVNSSSSEFNIMSGVSDVASGVLKGLAIAARAVYETFVSLGKGIGGAAAVISAVVRGEFSLAGTIAGAMSDDFIKSGDDFNKFTAAVLNGEKKIDNAVEAGGTKKILKFQPALPPVIDRTTQSLEKQGKAFDIEVYKLKQYEYEAKRARDITDSVATKQERYNKTLEELERLKPYLSVETYNRALERAQKELHDTGSVNSSVVSEMSQQWIQAGRNIQSALSNSIFDFFNGGLDDMVRNVKTAVLRMIAEFAALKFSEMVGLSAAFTAGGTGGTGAGQSTTGFLAGLAGMFAGSRGGRGITTGGGVTTGTFSNAGGAGTAFIGGKGTAIGGSGMGVNATKSSSLMNSGSLIGLASMAGPYAMAAAAAIMVGMELDKKYGDYKVSGFNKFGMNGLNKTDPIAVIANQFGIKGPGELMGKFLFGRGPYKFRQQSIQGDISAGGLDGTITDVFKSKGGVFVKNKHKEFEKDIPSEIIRDIDKNIKSIFKSTGEFAANLGIDAKSIDTFTKEIQIKSEKGKTLTTELVKEELDLFNEELIESFMPDIDNFKLTGESAGQTFERLNNELEALKAGVQSLGGSAEFAKKLIMDMSIDTRSAIIDMAGGIDKLIEKTQFFSENFLTESEQLAPVIAMVNEEMAKLGFSSVTTKDQFKGLVQSLEITAETRNALLDLAPAFLQVADAAEQAVLRTQEIRAAANQNMLSLAEEFAPDLVPGIRKDLANEVLGKFGVTVDTTREKVTELLTAFVKSGGLFTDMAGDVMNAAGIWAEYQKLLPTPEQVIEDPMESVGKAFSMLQKSVDAERKKLTDEYNKELDTVNTSIQSVSDSIGKLRTLSDSLKNTIDQIRPLTREEAKFQILSAINNAKRGIFPEAGDLQQALGVLGNSSSITGAKSSFEFAREQAKTAILLEDLESITDTQLTIEEKSLKALESQRDNLEIGFQEQMTRLDSMLEQGQKQIDFLNGIDTTLLALQTALGNFNRTTTAAGGGKVIDIATGKAPVSGNPNISKKDIRDYVKTPGLSEMDIYNAAKKYGVSFEQYADATNQNVEDLYAWARKRGLPTFASGGYHSGGLRIVGEKGPELEYTGPSRIYSNQQMGNLLNNDELVTKVEKLASKIEGTNKALSDTQKSLDDVARKLGKVIVESSGGLALRMKQAAA